MCMEARQLGQIKHEQFPLMMNREGHARYPSLQGSVASSSIFSLFPEESALQAQSGSFYGFVFLFSVQIRHMVGG